MIQPGSSRSFCANALRVLEDESHEDGHNVTVCASFNSPSGRCEKMFVYGMHHESTRNVTLRRFVTFLRLHVPSALQLSACLAYLRATHFYCMYCACKYTGSRDLHESCPGPSRDDHDEEEL